MKYLLDTDHISILERQASPEYPIVRRNVLRHPPADVGFPIISFHEQVRGAHNHINGAKTAAQLLRGYEMLGDILNTYRVAPVVPYDNAALVVFGLLRAQKIRTGTLDLRIAAIARSRNLIVVTRNVSDFGRVPGLVTEDWTK